MTKSWGSCKRQEAQEELRTAAAMYREMGMQSWLERTEAKMKGCVVAVI